MLEQSKGPLIYALMFRPDVLLYPVNPKQFAKYRESYPGGDFDVTASATSSSASSDCTCLFFGVVIHVSQKN